MVRWVVGVKAAVVAKRARRRRMVLRVLGAVMVLRVLLFILL